ncbi:hypothetical protein BH10ACT11_BH10ACT11_15820 [soil metagenome]
MRALVPRPSSTAGACRSGQAGQASIELLAGLPVLITAGLVALQLLATGYSASLADGAADAGALAISCGAAPRAAALAALPGWAERRAEVTVEPGRVRVTLEPPSPIGSLSEGLRVSSTAEVSR